MWSWLTNRDGKPTEDRGDAQTGGFAEPDGQAAFGFSEQALRELEALEARHPPPDVYQADIETAGWAAKGRKPGPAKAASGRPHYHGHRERLRQRFMAAGPNALPDYEILELILFNAIGRIDVKPQAKRLLAEFGDFNAVINAPEARLLKLLKTLRMGPKDPEKVLVQFRLAQEIAGKMARAKVIDRSVISSWTDLMSYCKTVMAHRDTEQFRVLFLDKKNVLTADEAQAKGTVDHVPVYPREVAKRALELNASAIILVHNHPSGDPTPSEADIAMTHQVAAACAAIGVTIHDHVVIGKETDASFARSVCCSKSAARGYGFTPLRMARISSRMKSRKASTR